MASEDHDWQGLSAWWLSELAGDPAYEDEVTPMLIDLIGRAQGQVLDVGCGEGRLMRALANLGFDPVGIDISFGLLQRARRLGPVVRGRLPEIGFLEPSVFDGAAMSLVLEHVEDHRAMLEQLARVVRSDGFLALVMNHPIYTAPDSGPITDADDEVLWRPGTYMEPGFTDEPAGSETIRFHHRPLGLLLTAAAEAGWSLERIVERGVTMSQIERYPLLAQQRHIPRLLGVRWSRR